MLESVVEFNKYNSAVSADINNISSSLSNSNQNVVHAKVVSNDIYNIYSEYNTISDDDISDCDELNISEKNLVHAKVVPNNINNVYSEYDNNLDDNTLDCEEILLLQVENASLDSSISIIDNAISLSDDAVSIFDIDNGGDVIVNLNGNHGLDSNLQLMINDLNNQLYELYKIEKDKFKKSAYAKMRQDNKDYKDTYISNLK
jgi:hypothetical protein